MGVVGWVGLGLGGLCVVVYGVGMILTRRNIQRWKGGDAQAPQATSADSVRDE